MGLRLTTVQSCNSMERWGERGRERERGMPSDLGLRQHYSDAAPVQQVGEGRNVVVGNQDRDAAEPHGVHQPWAPGLVATSTQAELGRLQCSTGGRR